MKLEEDLKAVRYIRECIDLVVNDEGFVIMPAWQFALFVKAYESYRYNSFAWLGLFVIMAAWFLIYMPLLG